MTEYCKHYRARAYNDTCEIGISYESVGKPAVGRPGIDFPCWNADVKSCPSALYPTPEEKAAEYAEIAQMVLQFQTDLDNDVCPHCKAKIEHWRQIGRCAYAEPCGHRLYQGKVPKGKK